MADSTHSRIEREREAAMPHPGMLKEFRKYARGRQKATLNAAQERILRSLLGNVFCDNVCAMVLQRLSNRVQLMRYEIESGGRSDANAITQYLREVWIKNNVGSLSSATHFAMLRDGVHGVSLSWNGERVVLTRETWWNGKDGIFIQLDDAGEPTYAVKEWKEDNRLRRTIWYPDHIERYIQNGAGWRPYRLPDDPQEGPIYWHDATGQPLGLPVVMFANTVIPNDEPGDKAVTTNARYGVSELDGGLMGLQDDINDLHRDISAAARFAGYQMLYATGVQPEEDAEGKLIPYAVEPGAVLVDSSPDAEFGVLPPGSLGELERALMIKLQAVSRLSSVPTHQLSGEWPSGEALIRSEQPLVDKAAAIVRAIAHAWGSVAHKSIKLANAFGGGGFDEEPLITSVFAPTERYDPITLSTIANLRAEHISNAEYLRLLGYTPEQVEQIQRERQEERQTEQGEIQQLNVERTRLALERERNSQAPTTIADRLRANAEVTNGA